MINANELRRGNKVISETHNLLNATFEGCTPNNLVFLKEVSTYELLDNLEPIPLTTEMLVAAGFRMTDRRDFIFFSKETDATKFRVFHYTDTDYYFFEQPNHKREYKYLHQLQNLYFALTGEELEIKL